MELLQVQTMGFQSVAVAKKYNAENESRSLPPFHQTIKGKHLAIIFSLIRQKEDAHAVSRDLLPRMITKLPSFNSAFGMPKFSAVSST